jgi:hypothetical protein
VHSLQKSYLEKGVEKEEPGLSARMQIGGLLGFVLRGNLGAAAV